MLPEASGRHGSPGASAPGFIAATACTARTTTAAGSPGASAPGFIAARLSFAGPGRSAKVTGGFGPRLHCGHPDPHAPHPCGQRSPGASAPGFIAAPHPVPRRGGPVPGHRGLRPPASLRPLAGRSARSPCGPGHRGLRPPASLRPGTVVGHLQAMPDRSPGASAPGFIAAVSGTPGLRSPRRRVTGGFGPRLHCGRVRVEVRDDVRAGHRGLRPPASLRRDLAGTARRPVGRGHRGLRPPASLRHSPGRAVRHAGGAVTGGVGPPRHCGDPQEGTVECACGRHRGLRPPASLRHPLVRDVRRHGDEQSPGASAPGFIAARQPSAQISSSPGRSPGASAPGFIAATLLL